LLRKNRVLGNYVVSIYLCLSPFPALDKEEENNKKEVRWGTWRRKRR
jgi:hypothetical protein